MIDLTDTLSTYASTITRQTGLQINLTTTGAPVLLSPQTNQDIFSLMPEGLNNIQKHAQAAPTTGHYGLAMLRERVAALQGEMNIESTPGRGTTLRFQVPLQTTSAVPHPIPTNEALQPNTNQFTQTRRN